MRKRQPAFYRKWTILFHEISECGETLMDNMQSKVFECPGGNNIHRTLE